MMSALDRRRFHACAGAALKAHNEYLHGVHTGAALHPSFSRR
jgi:hypothetical protein